MNTVEIQLWKPSEKNPTTEVCTECGANEVSITPLMPIEN